MERLTPAEEKVMLKLWVVQKGTVKDLVDLYPDPKPAYNTVSTIVRILEKKNFVKHKPEGRGYVYLPKVLKESYRDYLAENLLQHYFDNDRKEMISYFNRSATLSDIL